MDKQSLSAVVRGIQHAASSSYKLLAEQYLQLMMQYFDEAEDGVLVPRTAQVKIDEDHWVPVPLISLVNPQQLSLSRMKLAMSLRVEETTTVDAANEGSVGSVDRTSFQVRVCPPGSRASDRQSEVVDLEMEFAAGEPPAAVSRLLETFAHLVDPNNAHMDGPMDASKATRLKAPGSKPPEGRA